MLLLRRWANLKPTDSSFFLHFTCLTALCPDANSQLAIIFMILVQSSAYIVTADYHNAQLHLWPRPTAQSWYPCWVTIKATDGETTASQYIFLPVHNSSFRHLAFQICQWDCKAACWEICGDGSWTAACRMFAKFGMKYPSPSLTPLSTLEWSKTPTNPPTNARIREYYQCHIQH